MEHILRHVIMFTVIIVKKYYTCLDFVTLVQVGFKAKIIVILLLTVGFDTKNEHFFGPFSTCK